MRKDSCGVRVRLAFRPRGLGMGLGKCAWALLGPVCAAPWGPVPRGPRRRAGGGAWALTHAGGRSRCDETRHARLQPATDGSLGGGVSFIGLMRHPDALLRQPTHSCAAMRHAGAITCGLGPAQLQRVRRPQGQPPPADRDPTSGHLASHRHRRPRDPCAPVAIGGGAQPASPSSLAGLRNFIKTAVTRLPSLPRPSAPDPRDQTMTSGRRNDSFTIAR
jgi:hypothetical protein